MDHDIAALEANIDKNPLDPMNHYLLSDLHRERGNEDEADFRQAMGDWMLRASPYEEKTKEYHGRAYPWVAHQTIYPHLAPGIHPDLPEGVYSQHLPRARSAFEPDRFYGTPTPHAEPIPDYSPVWETRGHLASWRWTAYRHMEEAFRRAFMAGRKDQPEQLQRRIKARKLCRK